MHLRYFSLEEFDCTYSGKNFMDTDFLLKLDELRHRCKFSFVITSGYRDASHPIEARKPKPGYHNKGIAADVACTSEQAYIIIREATQMGFKAMYRGDGFVHLDMRPGPYLFMRV